MLRLLLLSLAVAYASAIVCLPDTCRSVRCADVTAESCVGGTFKPQGGFCGCCPICVTALAEGDKCLSSLLLGVPVSAQCGEGLTCDRHTMTCQRIPIVASKRTTSLSCAERLQQINNAESHGLPLLGQFSPSCDADGTYSARQCQGSVCFCTDPSGVQIPGYKSDIGQAANMDCQCARDQYTYQQSGLIGKMFFCTSSGNYQQYACTGSVCYCTDKMGAMQTGSQAVNIGQLADLRC